MTRTLVIKEDGIGDLIGVSGLLSALKQALPGELTLLTCEQNRFFAERIEGVDTIIEVSRHPLRPWRVLQRLGIPLMRPLVRMDRDALGDLAATDFDVAITLRRFIRHSTFRVMREVRAARKIAFWEFPTDLPRGRAERLGVGWERPCIASPPLAEQAYFLEALHQSLGLSGFEAAPHLDGLPAWAPPQPSERCVAVGLSGSSARINPAFWFALTERLQARAWRVTLLGGPDQETLGERLAEGRPGVSNRVGLDWSRTADVLARHRYYLGNDTGLTHFASLWPLEVVVLLGGGTYGRFFPWPQALRQHVLYHAMPCFDCDWKCRYDSPRCLEAITPEAVIDYLEAVFTGQASPRRNLHGQPVDYTLGWRYASVDRKPTSETILP